jgi:hypothetical protein
MNLSVLVTLFGVLASVLSSYGDDTSNRRVEHESKTKQSSHYLETFMNQMKALFPNREDRPEELEDEDLIVLERRLHSIEVSTGKETESNSPHQSSYPFVLSS